MSQQINVGIQSPALMRWKQKPHIELQIRFSCTSQLAQMVSYLSKVYLLLVSP